MEKDSFYFPHFYNARHDRKIKRLRKELGVEGYGIFFMLLEVLREQIDFKYPTKDIDLLAEEFGTSEQKVRVVICNYQLFEIDEIENFFSPKLVVYLQPYLKMKSQRQLAAKASVEARKKKALALQEPTKNSTTVERPLSECETTVEQSKVKESKVKESKINKDILEHFEKLWELYPKKKGKGGISDSKKNELFKIPFEEMERAIKRYKKYLSDNNTEEQFIMYGSTFFNSGYVDYLDKCFSMENKKIEPVKFKFIEVDAKHGAYTGN
jgi:hypothetical protein